MQWQSFTRTNPKKQYNEKGKPGVNGHSYNVAIVYDDDDDDVVELDE